MADVTPRFCWTNFAQFTGSLFTVSSQDSAAPYTYALDPLRSKKWKSALGWTVVAGYNDKLPFTEGVAGDKTATLAAGTYATGALFAAQVQTAMNAVAVDNTYTVTYSATTFKFTITRATGTATIGLEWLTGAAAATSCGLDLGFVVTADDTGATTYTSDNAAYQSRQFLTVQLTAAMQATFGAILDHNITAPGIVRLMGNSSDSWASPGTTQSLSDLSTDGAIRHKFFAGQTFQYWRFEILDVQNADGFIELGLFHFGDYLQAQVAHAVDMSIKRQELTQVLEADQGALFANLRPTAKIYDIEWVGIGENDRSGFETMADNRKVGRPFFFAFDPQNDATKIDYFRLAGPLGLTKMPPSYWRMDVPIKQALG